MSDTETPPPRPTRCPRDARVLRFDAKAGRWSCLCGLSFTYQDWLESPHRSFSEFVYDLGRR